MKKRIDCALLILVLALLSTACDSGNDSVPYRIGYNTWGAGTATFDFIAGITGDALAAYGAGYSRASDEHMADKELQNIQNFLCAGVDGIIMQTSVDPVLPRAAAECEEAGVPFVLAAFTGADRDRAAIRANNSVYVGAVDADKYAEGYLIGRAAIANGHRSAVMLGGNVGDSHMELRMKGFAQAFVTEGGGVILDEARCASPAEGQEKANAMLSAAHDADCLFAMVGDYVPGAINAMRALNLHIPIYVTNANTDVIPYIREGGVAAATAGNDLVCAVAAALLINYLDGHPILDENGDPPELKSVAFTVSADNVDDFETLFLEGKPFTRGTLRSLVYRYNETVSYNTFVDFVENHLSLETLLADRG